MADFRREYGIDLLGTDRQLGWRTFSILVGGLSADAVFWHRIDSGRRARQGQPVEGAAAEAVFAGWGGAPPKGKG